MNTKNHDDKIFESQYILESLATIDSGFIYKITHDSTNNSTDIVWMTSHMRDNFEIFGNYFIY